MRLDAAADDDDRFERGNALRRRFNVGQQRRGHERDLGARILEQKTILIDGQSCVQQYWHDAGADRAPEHYRKIDRVEHHHCHPVLALDAKAGKHRSDA